MCIHENTKTPEFKALADRMKRLGFIQMTTGTTFQQQEYTVFCEPKLHFIENAVADLKRWHPDTYFTDQTIGRLRRTVGSNKAAEIREKDYKEFRSEDLYPSVDFGDLPFEEMVQRFRDYGYAAPIKNEVAPTYNMGQAPAQVEEVAPGRPPGPLTPEEILAMSNELDRLKEVFHEQLKGLYDRVDALEENARLEAEAKVLSDRANAILAEIPNVVSFLDNLPEEELPEDNYRKILQEDLKKFGETIGAQIGEHVRQQINNMYIQYDEAYGSAIRRDITSAVHTVLDPRMQAVASLVDLIQDRARKIDKRLKRLEKARGK